jgi:hypothetical protein
MNTHTNKKNKKAHTYLQLAYGDPTAITAAKTLIINKCAGIQSYTVI